MLNNKRKGKYDYFELYLNDISSGSFQILANPYMDSWKYENIQKFLEVYRMDQNLSQSELRVKK